MQFRKQQKILSGVAFACMVFYVIFVRKIQKRQPRSNSDAFWNITTLSLRTKHKEVTPSVSLFLVDTPFCKIPDLQPYDPFLKGLLKPASILDCKKYKPYTFDKDNVIFIDWNAVNKSSFKSRLSHCRPIPISRPVTNTSDHNAMKYLHPGPIFNLSFNIGPLQHDHFLIKCFDKKEKILFENYHTIIIEKKLVEERCKIKMAERKSRRPDIKETLSTLVILVDSVSRVNSIRHMNKTRQFLLTVLNATDVAGLNKIGDRTYGNVIPLITGKTPGEFGWKYAKPTVFDSYRFVWDDFADNGYRTYYAEDFPYGTFIDYDKPGFRKNPTDYYNRHLFLSMYERPTKIVHNEENCILHKFQTEWVINNARKFITKFSSKPYFCIVMLTRITHDYLERTPIADNIYYEYLKTLNKDGLLNNTALFFMADHGMRYGAIQQSYNGKMEDRLPMLYVALPKWFHKKYPKMIKNLHTNSRRLTTPLDIHETFKDLLYFTGKNKMNGEKTADRKRSYSLFTEIPEERSCGDAGIPPEFCSCSTLSKVDVSSKSVFNSVAFILKNINSKLKEVHPTCENISVGNITSASEIRPASKTLAKTVQSYKIVFITKTGDAMFEGIVDYDIRRKIYKLGSKIKIRNNINYHDICRK